MAGAVPSAIAPTRRGATKYLTGRMAASVIISEAWFSWDLFLLGPGIGQLSRALPVGLVRFGIPCAGPHPLDQLRPRAGIANPP